MTSWCNGHISDRGKKELGDGLFNETTKEQNKLPFIAPSDKSQPHHFWHSVGHFEPRNTYACPRWKRQEGRAVRKQPCTYSTIVLPAVMSPPVSLNHQDWISHFQEIGPAKAFQSFASVVWAQVTPSPGPHFLEIWTWVSRWNKHCIFGKKMSPSPDLLAFHMCRHSLWEVSAERLCHMMGMGRTGDARNGSLLSPAPHPLLTPKISSLCVLLILF